MDILYRLEEASVKEVMENIFRTSKNQPFYTRIRAQLYKEALLSLQGERIVPTATGQLFVNTILEEFL